MTQGSCLDVCLFLFLGCFPFSWFLPRLSFTKWDFPLSLSSQLYQEHGLSRRLAFLPFFSVWIEAGELLQLFSFSVLSINIEDSDFFSETSIYILNRWRMHILKQRASLLILQWSYVECLRWVMLAGTGTNTPTQKCP